MARAHLYRPILDAQGNVRTDVIVRVLQTGTLTPIPETLYATDSDVGNATLTNPHTASTGVVSFFLAEPKRVRLGVRVSTGAESFIDGLDVLLPVDRPEPLIWVGTLAGGPPTDGSKFWYVTDETC